MPQDSWSRLSINWYPRENSFRICISVSDTWKFIFWLCPLTINLSTKWRIKLVPFDIILSNISCPYTCDPQKKALRYWCWKRKAFWKRKSDAQDRRNSKDTSSLKKDGSFSTCSEFCLQRIFLKIFKENYSLFQELIIWACVNFISLHCFR